MDPLDIIHSNMEYIAKQHGRWLAMSIGLSFLLLAVSLQIVTIKDDIPAIGFKITLAEVHLLALLIASVTITYSAAHALSLHEKRLREVFKKSYEATEDRIELSEEEWADCVETETIIPLMFSNHVIGTASLLNIPGLVVPVTIAFAGVLLPLISVLYGLFRIFSLIGLAWWLIPYGLISATAMFYIAYRAFRYS